MRMRQVRYALRYLSGMFVKQGRYFSLPPLSVCVCLGTINRSEEQCRWGQWNSGERVRGPVCGSGMERVYVYSWSNVHSGSNTPIGSKHGVVRMAMNMGTGPDHGSTRWRGWTAMLTYCRSDSTCSTTRRRLSCMQTAKEVMQWEAPLSHCRILGAYQEGPRLAPAAPLPPAFHHSPE